MTPKDFDDNSYDYGDDLLDDNVFSSSIILVSCVGLVFLVLIIALVWR